MEFLKWYGNLLVKLFRFHWFSSRFMRYMLSTLLGATGGVSMIVFPVFICVPEPVLDINGWWLLLIEPVAMTMLAFSFWMIKED